MLENDSKTFKDLKRNFWDYYIELEQEMLATRKYVAFTKENGKTYSIEYLKLYEAVCSEIDVFGKALASKLDNSFKVDRRTNIQKWWFVVQDWYFELAKKEVVFCGEYEISPWDGFKTEWYYDNQNRHKCRLANGSNIPKWWSAYNVVKHSRVDPKGSNAENYKGANLYNLSLAFAALYTLERNALNQLGDMNEEQLLARSVLFENTKLLLKMDAEGNALLTYDPDMPIPHS